jgi:hypothetical protein
MRLPHFTVSLFFLEQVRQKTVIEQAPPSGPVVPRYPPWQYS